MNHNSGDCPTIDDLRSFVTGRLNVLETDQLASHVETCPNCQTRMEQLDDTDASVDAAVGEHRRIAFTDESHCNRVLEAIASGNQSTSPSAHPQQLGDYALLESLGQGGMGMVYRARHAELGTLTAVKILQPHRQADQATIDRFEREMVAIGKLDHPNIVRALDAGEDAGQHYLVMEYVDGFDLNRVANANGSLSIADAAEVVRQAATGLSYVHRHGRVHRDIKPSNLILARDGTVKVMDLGLARVEEYPVEEATVDADDILGGSTVDLTRTHQVMGTPEYMPPEQVTDSGHVDHRADIYSLGCTLYKLLTGQSPMASSGPVTALNQLVQRVQSPTTPVRQKRPDVPPVLSDLLDRMLAKSPEDRPQSAEEVAGLLRPFAAGAHLRKLVTTTQQKLAPAFAVAETRDAFSTANDDGSAIRVPTASAAKPSRSARYALAGAAALSVLAAIVVVSSRPYSPTGTVVVQAESPEVAELLASGAASLLADDREVTLNVGTIEIPAGRYVVSTDAASRLKFSQSIIDLEQDQQLVLSVSRSTTGLTEEMANEQENAPEPIAVAASEEPSKYEPVNLISLVDPTRDIRGNDWQLVEGALISNPDSPSMMMFPYQPPDEYRVEMVATRLEKEESLQLGLVAGNQPVILAIDTYPSKGFLSGLYQLDGVELGGRPSRTHQGQLLPLGRPVPIVATLRRDGQRLSIDMTVGDTSILSWRGSVSQAAGAGDFPPPQPGFLFLANWTASIKVSDFRVVPLSGDGTIIAFTDPKLDRQRAVVEHVIWNGGAVSIVDKEESSEQRTTVQMDRWVDIPSEPQIITIDAQQSPWFGDGDIALIAELPDLESLDLSGTMVTSNGLQQLGSLPKLNSLSVAGTRVRDLRESLAKKLPSLTKLDLQNSSITDASVASVNGFNRLVNVDFGGTRLTAAGLANLNSLPELQTLGLSGTSVSRLDHLTADRFSNMSRLNLLGTRVTANEIVAVRERMPNMEIVSGLEPIDVISLVDVNRDADVDYNQGKTWRKENGRLLTTERTRISLPIVLPSDFDFRMTAIRISPGSAPVVGFALDDEHHFAVGFDSDPKLGYFTILHGVDGLLLQKSAVKVKGESFPIDAGEPVEVEVRVRKHDETAEIRVYRNGTELLAWEGDRSRLQQSNVWWKGPHPSQPWLSQYDGAMAIKEITVTPISGRIEASFPDEQMKLAEYLVLKLDLRGRDIDDEQLKEILDQETPTELTLEGPGITDASIDLIAANRQLRSLAMYKTEITESGIAQIADLPLLERIEFVSMPQITGDVTTSLEKMPALKHFHSNQTSLHGPGLERLHDRPILGLHIGHPMVDADVFASFMQPMKGLDSLGLAGSSIDDDAMKLFSSFEKLRMLHLGYNQNWKGPGLEYLKQIPTLRQLFLDASSINDESLKYLSGANQIQELFLRETVVSDASIDTLRTMKGLKSVNLEKTQFTAAGVERLRNILPQLGVTFDQSTGQ